MQRFKKFKDNPVMFNNNDDNDDDNNKLNFPAGQPPPPPTFNDFFNAPTAPYEPPPVSHEAPSIFNNQQPTQQEVFPLLQVSK